MKGLHNFLEKKVRPGFIDKEGKPKKLYWMYDALETFAFTPGHTTKGGTHIKDGIDLKRTMMMVILALVPCLLFGIFNVGHQHYLATSQVAPDAAWSVAFWGKFAYGAMIVLPIVIVSYGVGLGVEFIFCIVNKHPIQEGFLVSGMLIPLVMPPDVPLWMVAVGTVFAVLIGKEVFGGTGMNILNVALTARAFLFFAYPKALSGEVWISGKEKFTEEAMAQGYTGATGLGNAASTIDLQASLDKANSALDAAVSVGDGNLIEQKTKLVAELGDQISTAINSVPSMMESFWGLEPGCIGETSVLMILLGAGLLIFTGIGSWIVMSSMVVGGLVMGLIFSAFGDVNPYMGGIEPLQHIMLGGFMFGAVFMATDPVTAASTTVGKIWYGFFCGFFAIMIRVFNPAYPEGVMMAILFMNVMAPMIDHYVIQSNVKRRLKLSKA